MGFGVWKSEFEVQGLGLVVKVFPLLFSGFGVESVAQSGDGECGASNIYLVGSSNRPISTTCCFTMTNMIQVRRNFHVFIKHLLDDLPRVRMMHAASP